MADLPVFTTERLIVKPRSPADIDALVAMHNDSEVMRYIGDGSLPDPTSHRDHLAASMTQDARDGLGCWSVFARAAPAEFLGWTILTPLPGHDLIEIGWRFRRAVWGLGYATEAARPVLDYGFNTIGLDEIVAVVNGANARSIRVMEKLGLKAAGTCFAYGADVPIYRMKRP